MEAEPEQSPSTGPKGLNRTGPLPHRGGGEHPEATVPVRMWLRNRNRADTRRVVAEDRLA